MEDYHDEGMEQLAEEDFIIFLMATQGEGDPTDNARGFHDWMKSKEREGDELSKVSYTCFGLGNKQYEHYNKMGREFNKHMLRLGGKLVGEYGEGDDDDDLEGDFNSWMDKVLPAVADKFNLGAATSAGPVLEYELITHGKSEKVSEVPDSTKGIIDAHKWLPAKLTAMRELQDSEKSGRSTLHVELSGPDGTDYREGSYGYAPGDHVAVRCENNPKLVAALGSKLGLDLGSQISLKAKPGSVCKPYRFPSPCLLRDCLGKYLDICTPPTQEFLRGLAPFADGNDKEALEMLGSPNGKDRYQVEITKPCLNVLEVLDKYESLKPTAGAILELLPRLGTRFYSISSSPLAAKDSIHLTVAVVRYKGGDGSVGEREGVASTWFERMRTGRNVEIYMNKAEFKLPKKISAPVVMVGPGTGLAPFRGFIQERQEQKKGGCKTGETVMFFGCRSKSYDYIYQADLEAAEADGSLTNLLVAFSRDQAEKVYVQHLVEQQAALIYRLLIEEGGHFYICGDAAEMARDVQAALLKAVETAGGLSTEEAGKKIQELKDSHRFQLDVWA